MRNAAFLRIFGSLDKATVEDTVRNGYQLIWRTCVSPHDPFTMTTQFYHTRDPIANLRVCVIIRKVSVGDTRDSDVPVGTTWSSTFTWQEKQWPFAFRKPTKAQKPEDEATSVHDGIALCSYVDADNYEPADGVREPSTTSPSLPTHLVAAAADYHLSQTSVSRRRLPHEAPSVGTSNRDRVALRAHREETFRQMHLVLRNDDKSEDLVLTSLRYYPQTGLLCATPGFSTCLVDDKDTEAIEKGPKLSTYRVRSQSTGAQFEYALDNVNDLWPTVSNEDHHLLRELLRQDELDDRANVDAWCNKHGDPQVLEDHQLQPNQKPQDEEMMILLEIVSVVGLHASDPIRVVVDLLMPDNEEDVCAWRLRNGAARTRTRLSRMVLQEAGMALASFGHHTQIILSRVRSDATPRALPTLRVTVMSLDSWDREVLLGQGEMQIPRTNGFRDSEVALWRPLLAPREQMEAFFLGRGVDDAGVALTTSTAIDTSKSIMSRLGAQTESTGALVRVRLQSIQSHPHRVARRPTVPPALRVATGGGVLKRSVEEILQSVKMNQHAAMVHSTGLPPLTVPSANVTALLARIRDPSNRPTTPSAS